MSDIQLPDLRGEHLFTAKFEVATPTILENTPYGTRIIAGITGGSFEGPKLKGTVAPIPGGDWILIRNDGVWQMDVRITLVTDDDHHIFMTYRGIRHGTRKSSTAWRRASLSIRPSIISAIHRLLRPARRSTAGSTASSPSAPAIASRKARSTKCMRFCSPRRSAYRQIRNGPRST